MSEATAGPTDGQICRAVLASIIGSVIERCDSPFTGVIAGSVWAAPSLNCRALQP